MPKKQSFERDWAIAGTRVAMYLLKLTRNGEAMSWRQEAAGDGWLGVSPVNPAKEGGKTRESVRVLARKRIDFVRICCEEIRVSAVFVPNESRCGAVWKRTVLDPGHPFILLRKRR
jgi:hypothetical protein